MPESVKEDFRGPQPRGSATRSRLFEIDDQLANRIPDRLGVGVSNGEGNWCAAVGRKEAHTKATRLTIRDQNAWQALIFRHVGASAIHAADDAKVLTACVALFARHHRFLRAGFGLCGLCGLYRGMCTSLRISGILRP